MIKVVALDVYGTIACSGDSENVTPFRNGLERFFSICEKDGIKIVTSSDAPIENLKNDLIETAENNQRNYWFSLDKIHNFYRMEKNPKELGKIVEMEEIKPRELFVIGDNERKDIQGAIECGANYQLVKPYNDISDYDDLGGEMRSFDEIIKRHSDLFKR